MTSQTQSRWAATATPGRVRDRIGKFVELVKAQIMASALLAIAVLGQQAQRRVFGPAASRDNPLRAVETRRVVVLTQGRDHHALRRTGVDELRVSQVKADVVNDPMA